ncbi:ankyrin repeat domain 34Bb [Dunckerocampus dactyliophorus]|uniref:ankyrin repeat domain 34Bb n=1 Tax=Dunckerocampus dactyliophorus TaxID=161453 RepID=UPI0024073677|nr:ankyrin repeat domain 34Bb [Dunckerocampus dactyliophorus]
MDESTEVRTDGNSLLKAISLSRLRLTRLLLEGGAYINESNDYGETPLMVACKTRHSDAQSVPKHKMVQYLLENGADPNIQDKSGKTALMHACLAEAGSEIVSLLLSNGADPTVEDTAGLSVVVYAINAGNRDILKILLDACKAKGKEVIIITTNKLPSGHQTTKQYLNVPPHPDLDECLHCTPTCASPYNMQRRISPQGSPQPLRSTQCPGRGDSQPGFPLRVSNVDKRRSLQRLHSEQWSKGPPTLLQKNQSSLLTEERVETPPEEELSFRGLNIHSQPQSTDVKDAPLSGSDSRGQNARRIARKMSYDSAASAPHSASHPNLHQENKFSTEATSASESSYDGLGQFNVSSLQNVILRRNIGADHYSSDSQLSQFGSKDRSSKGPARPKMANSRSSTLSGSRESLDCSIQRRGVVGLERRGSGALLQDHIASTRPGYLPPLNLHAPIPDIGVSSVSLCPWTGSSKPVKGGFKPIFPRDLKSHTTLWRRHSMQSEQIKQLANFEQK